MALGRSFRTNYSSLGQQTFTSKQVISAFLGLLVAVGLITTGSLLVADEGIIKDIAPSKTSSLNYTLGSICIVIGCLMVLYGAFRFFTKAT